MNKWLDGDPDTLVPDQKLYHKNLFIMQVGSLLIVLRNSIILFILLFLLPHRNAKCQGWIPLGEGLLPDGYSTWSLSAVDENTVYSTNVNLQDPFAASIILRTVDGGTNWDVIEMEELGWVMDIHAVTADSVWITTLSDSGLKQIQVSNDGGANWESRYSFQGQLLIGPTIHFNGTHGCAIDISQNKAILSDDGGATWSSSNMPTQIPGAYWNNAGPANWMEMTGEHVWWGNSKSMYHSTDDGVSWVKTDIEFNNGSPIHSIAFGENGTGITITNRGYSGTTLDETILKYSPNFGVTWGPEIKLDFHLESITDVPDCNSCFIGVGGILKDLLPDDTFVVNSAFTPDGGITWLIIDSELYSGVEFVSNSAGWAGRVSSHNYGGNPSLFKWDGSVLEGTVATEEKSRDPILNIYPNPFTDQLVITLDDMEAGLLFLRDVNGKLIYQTPFNGKTISIDDLPALPAGMYLLEIQGSDFSQTIKLVK